MEEKRRCDVCKRDVAVVDGLICTHGPGPANEFVCPGSGDKSMVKAAAHLSASDCYQQGGREHDANA